LAGIERREYSKSVRIAISFPNANDFSWNLDIKKSGLPLKLERIVNVTSK
jgi:hypothetical protein